MVQCVVDEATFISLAKQGYNRIPVIYEVLADLETPLSVYLKFASQPYTFLFESVQGGEKWGRYSIIGLPSRSRIEVRGTNLTYISEDKVIEQIQTSDPLQWIERFQSRFNVPDSDQLPEFNSRFNGGLVGYFGYDTVRYVEKRMAGTEKNDPINAPDILLMLCDEYVVFDNLSGRLYLVAMANPQEDNAFHFAVQKINLYIEHLKAPLCTQPLVQIDEQQLQDKAFQPETDMDTFMASVERIKQYITEGDVMQVVLSQRMSVDFTGDPLHLYRALRSVNPSPYLFYLNLSDFYVVGSSPEILVRCEQDEVTIRPLAGTRLRGQTPAEDLALEKELLADPKEIAEHLMLIDLGRNDVGRVATIGSVEVTEQMHVERYSHVMHIVSNVTGALKPGLTSLDALKAALPAGTLSGAPKVRAMEIIDELEPTKRGIYGGAIGYVAYNNNMDVAIAIRTAIIKDKKLYLQAGAGVVSDSVPKKEWEETLNKGRVMFKAVSMAESGLFSA